MIPKKLHLCWLSDRQFPVVIRKCLESRAAVLPDYETRLWTSRDARSIGCQYIDQAIDAGEWKAASDAISFYALMKEGGVYMDCDVTVVKRFDRLVPDRGFEAFINAADSPLTLHSAVMIGEKDNRFCREIFEYYLNRPFIHIDGSHDGVTAADVLSRHAMANRFRQADTEQLLDPETIIMPGGYVTVSETSDNTFARIAATDCWQRRQPKPTARRMIADTIAETAYRVSRLFKSTQLPPCR